MSESSDAAKALAVTAFLGTLLALNQYSVADRYYKGQVLTLDGYKFRNCCFHNCTLIVDKGTFEFDKCTIIGCRFEFGATARKTVQFYNLVAGPVDGQPFLARRDADGSVTI
jgi:hypothetical protein